MENLTITIAFSFALRYFFYCCLLVLTIVTSSINNINGFYHILMCKILPSEYKMEANCQSKIDIYYYDYENCSYWNFDYVSTPYWRFYWCPKPAGEIIFDNKKILFEADRFILIPPNVCFSTRANKTFEQFYMHFSAGPPFDSVCRNIYICKMSEHIKAKIMEIKLLLSSSNQNNIYLNSLLFSLICEALLKIPQEVFIENNFQYDTRVNKIIELLDRSISKSLSNEELANKINMSVNAFIRLFSVETGMSAQKYFRNKKIEKACLLLHFSKKSIDEIAQATGFEDRYYFSRVFKQVTNYSPAQFRNIERDSEATSSKWQHAIKE